MSISSGNVILASEFNSIQSRISQVLGIGFGDFGYGQAISSSPVKPPSQIGAIDADDISINQMNEMLTDLRKIYEHQRGEVLDIELFSSTDIIGADETSEEVELYYNIDAVKVITGGSGFSENVEINFSQPELENGRIANARAVVEDGTILEIIVIDKGSGYLENPTISFSETPVIDPNLKVYLGDLTSTRLTNPDQTKSFTNFIQIIADLEDKTNRFNVHPSQSEIEILEIDRRTTPWTNSIVATVEARFSSGDQRRYFFNSGGEIMIEGILSDLDQGSASYQNNQIWSKLIGNSGIIAFGYNYTRNTGNPGSTPPNGPTGNYDLTDDYQIIFSRGGPTDTEQFLYADSEWTISAREKNNSTIEFSIEIKDRGPEGGDSNPDLYGLYLYNGNVNSLYTPNDEPVTATIEFEYAARKASGAVITEYPAIEITNSLE